MENWESNVSETFFLSRKEYGKVILHSINVITCVFRLFFDLISDDERKLFVKLLTPISKNVIIHPNVDVSIY